MITDWVYDDDNFIALQALDADDFEGCEFSKKFTAKSSADMKNLMDCVGHENDPKYSKNVFLLISR